MMDKWTPLANMLESLILKYADQLLDHNQEKSTAAIVPFQSRECSSDNSIDLNEAA